MKEYGYLKKVIVGEETYENTKYVDATLKLFFKDNLDDYYQSEGFVKYDIPDIIIKERKEDLNNLAKVLSNNNIEVKRPIKQDKLKSVKTPDFKSVFYSNSNVRDLCICIKDYIICSFSSVRSRFFENQCLLDILHEEIQNGKKIIFPPLPTVKLNKIDKTYWKDFIFNDNKNFYPGYEILFDCANIIKVTDNDLIMNITTKNAYNGYIWLKSILPDDIKIHPICLCDNHIDGTILPLNEGLFLANTCFLEKDIESFIPNKFKKWNIIETNDGKYDFEKYDKAFLQGPTLASFEGMNMNVLSISPDKIIAQDTLKEKVIDKLIQNKINVLPIKFRHGTIFGGGIHCSTLDLERD